jgi:RIC1
MLGGLHGMQDGSPLHDMLRQAPFRTEAPLKHKGAPITLGLCWPRCLQYADVVVSVARKMDAALWPALFDAVGPPDALAEGLLAGGQPVSAACCLLIVDRLQGAPTAQALALRNIQVPPPPAPAESLEGMSPMALVRVPIRLAAALQLSSRVLLASDCPEAAALLAEQLSSV